MRLLRYGGQVTGYGRPPQTTSSPPPSVAPERRTDESRAGVYAHHLREPRDVTLSDVETNRQTRTQRFRVRRCVGMMNRQVHPAIPHRLDEQLRELRKS